MFSIRRTITSVMSRMIMGSLLEQIRSSPIPVLHGLHGRAGIEGSLRQMVVVEPSVAQEGLLQVLAAEEVMAAQHLFDTTVEALHHAVGLGPPWTGKPMFDAQRSAQLIEGVLPGGGALTRGDEAVGEFVAPEKFIFTPPLAAAGQGWRHWSRLASAGRATGRSGARPR